MESWDKKLEGMEVDSKGGAKRKAVTPAASSADADAAEARPGIGHAKSNQEGGEGAKKKDESKEEIAERLIQANATLALVTSAKMRMILPAVCRTWTMKAEHPICAAAIAQKTDYDEKVKGNKKKHGLGAPDLHVWRGVVMEITKTKTEEVPQEIVERYKKEMEVIKNHMEKCTHEYGVAMIHACRITKAFDSTERKLEIVMAEPERPTVDALSRILALSGVSEKRGAGPRWGTEREVADLTDAYKKASKKKGKK